jgi:hypothetical protein
VVNFSHTLVLVVVVVRKIKVKRTLWVMIITWGAVWQWHITRGRHSRVEGGL